MLTHWSYCSLALSHRDVRNCQIKDEGFSIPTLTLSCYFLFQASRWSTSVVRWNVLSRRGICLAPTTLTTTPSVKTASVDSSLTGPHVSNSAFMTSCWRRRKVVAVPTGSCCDRKNRSIVTAAPSWRAQRTSPRIPTVSRSSSTLMRMTTAHRTSSTSPAASRDSGSTLMVRVWCRSCGH